MVLAFWFNPDVSFFRETWPICMLVMFVWAIIRREKDGEEG
jgi:hypothetical protein